jgi:hypothetical protein
MLGHDSLQNLRAPAAHPRLGAGRMPTVGTCSEAGRWRAGVDFVLDSNLARLVSRDEQADLLARARELPDAPTCADWRSPGRGF